MRSSLGLSAGMTWFLMLGIPTCCVSFLERPPRICCLASRSPRSRRPWSKLRTSPPAADAPLQAVDIGMLLVHLRRRCRCWRRMRHQPSRCSSAASEIGSDSRRQSFICALRLCAYEDARVAYQTARPQRTQVLITRPAVSEPISDNDPWFGGVFFRSARQESAQSVYTFFETLAELDTTICMRVERIAKTRC